MHIVIIEDEPVIRQELKQLLENALYQVTAPEEFEDVAFFVLEKDPDLVLLDVNLPGESGYDICTRIRAKSEVPIIFVTSRTDSMDELMGMLKGGDDYITKPFSPKELVLRVNNLMRRVYRDEDKYLSVDGYDIDENQRTVVEGSTQIELTTKEFDLLMMFVNNRGKAFPREKILEQVWEENYFGSDRVVDDTLRRLRKKMPNLSIKTIYGFGYKLG